MADAGKESTNDPAKRELLSHWLSVRTLRDICIVAAIGVVAWKIANAPFNISIDKFSFTDLLALILALFSVWLSALFYFKADEASSRFYDNSYNFTRDMHVVLGRIEASFGERLKHLDEGYNRMNNTLAERLATEKIVVEEKEAEVIQLAQNLTNDVSEVTPESEKEKQALMNDLRRANSELAHAKGELSALQKMAAKERERASPTRPPGSGMFNAAIAHVIHVMTRQGNLLTKPLSMSVVRELFEDCRNSISPAALNTLNEAGLMDNGRLNNLGAKEILRTLAWDQSTGSTG
ncbi:MULTISPECIES: hypothetical protein [unclassified Variovorax]|uniref:hypothetical protein n=1 Tax=unclassified Variovorax TaxID=663243 RepID=UPI003F477715